MGKAGSLAKNAAYLTVASILQKIISFAYYGYLANSLGENLLGKYTFALTFTSVFIIFMDFGLGPLLTREGSKDEEQLQNHFQRLFSIKIILILATLAVLFPAIHIADSLLETVDSTDVMLVYVASIIIIFDTLNFTLFSIFRAVKRMIWEAYGIVIYQTAIVVSGVLALKFGLPLQYVLGALLVGSATQFVYLFIAMKKKIGLTFHFEWNWRDVKKTIAIAAPFAVAGLLFRLNGSLDSIMLKAMAGDAHVGWYALAFKLIFALTVLPGAFATSYFPTISHHFKHAKEKLHEVFENGVFYMLLLGFPTAGGVLVLGDDIIYQVWSSAWKASIEPLWILVIGLPFVFLNYPVGNFLNAVDKQKLNTVNMFIALGVNAVLNAVLIPKYTFNGAAIAAVASSIVLVILGTPWVYKVAPFRMSFLIKKAVLITIPTAVMGATIMYCEQFYPIMSKSAVLAYIVLGAAVYTVSLFVFRGMTLAEFKSFKKSLLRR